MTFFIDECFLRIDLCCVLVNSMSKLLLSSFCSSLQGEKYLSLTPLDDSDMLLFILRVALVNGFILEALVAAIETKLSLFDYNDLITSLCFYFYGRGSTLLYE